MTTIIANGYYMIGDRRTTGQSRGTRETLLKSYYEGFKATRPASVQYQDESTKVIPLPNTTYKEKKVVCIAGSGNVENIMEFLNLLNFISLDDLIRVKKRVQRRFSLTQLLLITEDNHTHRVSFSFQDSPIISEITAKPGKTLMIGSGGFFVSRMEERFPGFLDKVHPLSAFLFATNTDKSSSNCYDVYGVKENQYHSKILPTDEEVETRCKEVSDCFTFGHKNKVHKFGIKQKKQIKKALTK